MESEVGGFSFELEKLALGVNIFSCYMAGFALSNKLLFGER